MAVSNPWDIFREPAAPNPWAIFEWEPDPQSPGRERKRKAGGGWEYRAADPDFSDVETGRVQAKRAEMADALRFSRAQEQADGAPAATEEEIVRPDSRPPAGPESTGVTGDLVRRFVGGVRGGMTEGADFLLHLPETVGRAVGTPVAVVADEERRRRVYDAQHPDEGPSSFWAPPKPGAPPPRPLPEPEGLTALGVPPIVEETFQNAREERERRSAEKPPYLRTDGDPAYGAGRVTGNLLDPTILLGGEELRGAAAGLGRLAGKESAEALARKEALRTAISPREIQQAAERGVDAVSPGFGTAYDAATYGAWLDRAGLPASHGADPELQRAFFEIHHPDLPELAPPSRAGVTRVAPVHFGNPITEIDGAPRPSLEKIFAPESDPLARAVEPHRGLSSEQGYAYHATNRERAYEIRDSALEPRSPEYGTEQDEWPDGGVEDRSYWSPRADNVWQFAPEEGDPVILRTPLTKAFKGDGTGDLFRRKPVPPENLEVLTNQGWEPLRRAEAELAGRTIPPGVERLDDLKPPRIPLDSLPDPTVMPRREFAEIAPLPEPVSDAVHREAVEQAVGAGERVRPSVLADYPELGADVAVPAGKPGEQGFVKIPVGPTFLRRWFTKEGKFSALGDLRGWTFERANLAAAEEKAGQARVRNVLRDFSSAFEDDVVRAGHDKPDDVLDYLTAGLAGENDLSGVSPKLRAAAEAMRQHYDELSEGYLTRAPGDLSPALRDAIEQNRGSYQHRAFAAFENPDWGAIVDPTSPRHDPREAWRWNQYMDWAKGERDKAASAPLYPGAVVRVSDQSALQLATQHGGGFENSRVARVISYDPQAQAATIRFEVAGQAVDDTVSRTELANLADHMRGDWSDDQLAAYGQRLLHRDPDALFSIGRPELGREGRGNLKRRILQDPTVDRLPSDLGAQVQAGKLSLPGAIEQAKQRPGWWADYLSTAEGLPKEIDDLMGLYRDPSQRYAAGALRAVHDQAVYKLHADLAEQGLGKIFFTEDTMRPGFFEKIGGKGPLAELVTSPEIAAVIRGTENTAHQVGPWLNAWRKFNGVTKMGKTVLNFPGGVDRNALAWIPQLMSGGHFVAAFNPARPIQLLPYQIADKLGTKRGHIVRLAKALADSIELADGTRLGERWGMKLDELRPEIDFLYRQGIFGESSHAADIRHYTGAFPTLREPAAVSGVRRGVAGYVQAGTNFWAGGDDLGKHIYYRAELQNLLWANNKLGALKSLPADYFTREEYRPLAEEAARRTRLVTPTATMQAPYVGALRDVPAAPFPGWTSEIFRNAKEQVRLGLADLRDVNPRMKVLGAKRLSGFLAAAALSTSRDLSRAFARVAFWGGALGYATDKVAGNEDSDWVRSFVYPWSRDSQLAVLNVDRKTGQVRTIDLSALMPYAAFTDAAGTILRSAQDPADSSWDASLDATQSLLGPYLEEEITANAILDWMRNKQGGESAFFRPLNMLRVHEHDDPGYPVYTEKAKTSTQVKQSLYHFWRNLAPAGLVGLQGERLARAITDDNPEVRKVFVEMTNYDRQLDVKDEGMAAMGLRVSTLDISKSLKRMGSDYARQRAEASSLYTRRSRMGVDQKAHPEVIIAAKQEANQMGRASHEQLARVIADAMRGGFTETQIRNWMRGDGKGFGVSKKQLTALLNDARRLMRGEEIHNYIPVVE